MFNFHAFFGREPQAPRSAEEPATDHIWPSDIRRALRKGLGISDVDARRIYHALFDPRSGMISVAVDAGKDVHLSGLGKFERRERTAGQVMNPLHRRHDRGTGPPLPAFQESRGSGVTS